MEMLLIGWTKRPSLKACHHNGGGKHFAIKFPLQCKKHTVIIMYKLIYGSYETPLNIINVHLKRSLIVILFKSLNRFLIWRRAIFFKGSLCNMTLVGNSQVFLIVALIGGLMHHFQQRYLTQSSIYTTRQQFPAHKTPSSQWKTKHANWCTCD